MKINKYKRLKDYLEGNDIAFLSSAEMDDVIGIVLSTDDWAQNVGHRVERIKDCEREKAFHETWLSWNEPRPWVNFGGGILQDLFIEPGEYSFERKFVAEISHRERWIVATVIQWLGTNVGMSFLHEALGKAGFNIVSRK